jgi:RNA polymerase sigma-70 factor (ECF subfamily)
MQEAKFQEMMSRAKAGDTTAVDALLAAGFSPLRSAIVRHMADSLQKAQLEPEDVIQETYAAAWGHLPESQFESFDAFVGWLRQIAENKLIDLHRAATAGKRDVRRKEAGWGVKSESVVNLLDRVSSPMATPSKGAARSEAVAVLMARMQRLPEDYRRVIHWRLIQGLSVEEVAKRLDRSEAAVHMLCHRALKQLRDLMGQESDYLTKT